jgi:hypothetical protein
MENLAMAGDGPAFAFGHIFSNVFPSAACCPGAPGGG